jgi:hypothetical protein
MGPRFGRTQQVGVYEAAALSVDGTKLYIGSNDNNLNALDAHTGSKL